MPSEYSFLDVAVLDAVRQRFAAGDAITILSVDLEHVIWANGPGAAVFGYPDIEAIIGASAQLTLVARRQTDAALEPVVKMLDDYIERCILVARNGPMRPTAKP